MQKQEFLSIYNKKWILILLKSFLVYVASTIIFMSLVLNGKVILDTLFFDNFYVSWLVIVFGSLVIETTQLLLKFISDKNNNITRLNKKNIYQLIASKISLILIVISLYIAQYSDDYLLIFLRTIPVIISFILLRYTIPQIKKMN